MIINENTKAGWITRGPTVKFRGTSTVTSGVVTFNLTDDGTPTGNAIFTNIYNESINLWVNDQNAQYQMGNTTVSSDKKTISFNINTLGSVLLGIIQFISAANGIVICLQVEGDSN